MKKLYSILLAVTILVSTSTAAFAVEPNEAPAERTGSIEFTLDSVTPKASNYYSRALPIFNIATGGVSGQTIISAPSMPSNTKITGVTVTGTLSGGSATWVVTNSDGSSASAPFAKTVTFKQFNNGDADTDWTIWIRGAAWTTVKGSTFRVDYTY